jgi:hypothetical protein
MKLVKIFGILAIAGVPLSCASVDNAGSGRTDDASASSVEAELVAPWKALACASSAECPVGAHCTTEDGVCNRPPGCKPEDICPAVCYGTCKFSVTLPPTTCGGNICGKGTFCCNASCGTCAPVGGACTQQICDSPI